MTNPTSNFGWQMPTSTDLVTDLPADFEVFGQAVDTALADLKGGTTGQVLKKNTNTDMDFVWSADAAGMTNPMTTTGDTIYSSSGSTPARLGIGSAGQLLQVNSGATAPEWTTFTSGGMTLISETVASGNSSISFSSIAGTFKQLMLVWDGIYHSDGSTLFSLRFNNSSSAIYTGITHYNDASSSAGSVIGDYNTNGTYVVNTSGAGVFGNGADSTDSRNTNRGWFTIDNYASTTKYKNYRTEFSHKKAVVYTPVFCYRSIGSFDSTSAITSLDIVRISGSGTISNVSDTSIRLYGIA